MRLLFSWEIEKLLFLIDDKNLPINNHLTDKEIIAVNDGLRKNIVFYLNNFVQFMPKKEPRSVYVNLRIKDDLMKQIQGKMI